MPYRFDFFFDILGGSHKFGGRWIEVSAEQFAQTEGLRESPALRECGEKKLLFFWKDIRIKKSWSDLKIVGVVTMGGWQGGRVVRVLDFESVGPGFESHSEHFMDLFLGCPEL